MQALAFEAHFTFHTLNASVKYSAFLVLISVRSAHLHHNLYVRLNPLHILIVAHHCLCEQITILGVVHCLNPLENLSTDQNLCLVSHAFIT